MMRKGPTLKATAKRRVSRGLMVVREARCVSLSPVSRLAQIGAAWSALGTRPLRVCRGNEYRAPIRLPRLRLSPEGSGLASVIASGVDQRADDRHADSRPWVYCRTGILHRTGLGPAMRG